MPTVIEGNIEALSKNGNNIFPITTPRAVIEEGSERNLLDMLQDAARIPTAAEVGAASEEMISDAWVAGNAYAVGGYCIHNNTLWRCKVANTGVAPAEGTYWTAVNVMTEIAAKKIEAISGYHDDGEVLTIPLSSWSPEMTHWVAIRGTGNSYYSFGFITAVSTANNQPIYMPVLENHSTFSSQISISNNVLTMPKSGYYRYYVL